MDGHREGWREEFLRRVEAPEQPPLFDSALALSRYLQRGETWSGTRELLEELEEAATSRCSRHPSQDADARAGEIMLLLEEYGFEGNDQNYEDIRNSFIDRVLQTRLGLPITLGVLSLHLAQAANVDLVGIGFPGHFLIGAGLSTQTPSIFDPFNGGRRLSFSDLAALYRAATGKQMTSSAPLLRDALRPVTQRDVISRMLRNLQHHYSLRGSHDRVADVVGLLAALHPELSRLRDLQGKLHRRLETLN